VGNDPDFENYQEGIYVNHDEILKMGKPGYSRIEMALAASSWTVHDNIPAAFSPIRLAVDPSQKFDADLNRYMMNKYEYDDIIKMTKTVKQVAISFGASLVGVTKLNRDWIYTHARDGTKNTIPDHINNVIVMAIEMDLEAIQSSPALVSGFATGNAYSRMAFAQASLAEFIRELGYEAIPAGNGTGLSVPLAIDAGLGQYGRHGLLITEEFGSNVRICKVFTNLPLEYDEPKEFGVLDFCRTCKRCAENCPSQSISHDENPSWSGPTRSNNPGILKWYVNVESCFDFWTKNGSDCSNCISSCPFTKNRHFSHGIARFVIRRLPFLNKLWVKIDHWMGYGKQRTADEFWDEDREFLHTR
jgi:reductive dehalogenase